MTTLRPLALLLGTVSLTALALMQQALAQEPEVLDEITVEAQRREQELVEVPISVRVFTEKDITARTIERLEDAFEASVNTLMRSQRGGNDASTISIRGVTNTAFGTDPTVAIYMDDVFIGNDASFNLTLADLEQIEILRGPQGTLYGRNALAGAVNIRSARPDPDGGFYGHLESIIGTGTTLQGRAVVNAPIGTDAAIRAVAFGDYSKGWVENAAGGPDLDGADDYGLRVQALARPSDKLELLAAVDYTRDDGSRGTRGPIGTVWDDGYNAAIPFDSSIESYGASLRAAYDLGWASLISVSAWRGADGGGEGGDFTPSPFRLNGYDRDYDQLTQEVRLVSTPNDTLDWTLGMFLFGSEEARYEYTGFTLPLPADTLFPGQPALPAGYREGTNSTLKGWSAAGFGDATWHVTDRLDLLGGVRVTYDRREIDYDHASNVPGLTLGAPAQQLDEAMSNVDTSPKIGLSYALLPEVRAYATVSRGYKSGGYNLSFAPDDQIAYDPESAWNYETGIKGSFFDGKLDVSAAVFYFDWENQQIYSFNGYSVWIANAPKSRSYGAEFEVTARPIEGLELFAGLGLLNARFIDAPASQSGGDADGNWQPFASRYSVTLSAQYSRPINDRLKALARLDWNWRSRFYFDVDNTIEQPAYGLVNGRIGVEGEKWSLYLIGRNLFDQEYYTVATDNGYGPYAAPGDPRMVGVQARITF